MSLQVRLRHALGERLLELPDRPVDEPVAVGRSSSADVQVPSVSVAQRHCVLFVHDDRWAIQEMVGNSGTFVNGVKVAGPTFLRVGDVITLGPEANAPTLEVDPDGTTQGRAGQAAGAVGIAAVEAPAQPAQPAYPLPTSGASTASYAAPAGYGYPVPAPAGAMDVTPSPVASAGWSHIPQAMDETAGAGGPDTLPWPTDAGSTSRYYGRRPRRGSDSGLTFGILLTLVILGAVGFFVYQRRQQTAQMTPPLPPGTTQKAPLATTRRGGDEDTSQMPASIFDKTNPRTGKAATRPGTLAPPRRPGRATSPAALPDGQDAPLSGTPGTEDVSPDGMSADASDATGQDAADSQSQAPAQATPQADDAEWKQVQTARFSRDEAKGILKFDDYARSHPDQFSAQIAEYTDKAMDRIWLERLEQLCKQREELTRKMQDADKEAAEETNDAYKKRVLIPLKEQYVNRLRTVGEELKNNMKYDAPRVPNLLDETQVEALRRQRDPAFYAGWKSRVLTHIRRTHGELPWTSDKNSVTLQPSAMTGGSCF